MANYVIDPNILLPYLPSKTELDMFEGKCFVSLIGFMFLDTRLKGIPIPFHQNFEEVNLRFYVKYKDGNNWKRGTVFIKEIVPKFMISLVANTLYGEHYETRPMSHTWNMGKNKLAVEYNWKTSIWNKIELITETQANEIVSGSETEFITEHYWGYTKLNEFKTSEYGVEHPKWQIYNTLAYEIECDFAENYGKDFAFLDHVKPNSVFLVEGSEILVREGGLIKD
jgi:uncharacterized protein YqjF (DUF2071 family)